MVRSLSVALAVLGLLPACDSSDAVEPVPEGFGPAELIEHELTVFPPSAMAGEEVTVGFLLRFFGRSRIRLRASCAVLGEVYSGTTLVGTIPADVSCPDSTAAYEAVTAGVLHIGLPVDWRVPDSLPSGMYTITSRYVVDPVKPASIAFTVQ